MSGPINNQQARLLAAECAFYAADLAYNMCAAQFDVASRALTEARTNLLTEQSQQHQESR